MTPDQRAKLLRWLYLFGPALSLLLVSPFLFFGLGSMLPNALPSGALKLLNIAIRLAPFGWGLVTLGCSAGTAWEYLRPERMMGRAHASHMILTTIAFAIVHIFVIVIIVFAALMISSLGIQEERYF